MTPREFYQRIDQERGEMSLASFLREFEDFSSSMVYQFRAYRTQNLLPSIKMLIALEDIFTNEEMLELLTSKVDEGRGLLADRKLAQEHIDRLREEGLRKCRRREVSRRYWLERAMMEDI